MREMKKYHLAHHYKNFELGFGVTSKLKYIYLLKLLSRLTMFITFRQNLGLCVQHCSLCLGRTAPIHRSILSILSICILLLNN